MTSSAAHPPALGSAPRLHLDFLDGLRGLAALYVVLTPLLLGSAAAALIVAATRTSQKRLSSPILSVLSSRFAVVLGTFSCSIYLIHDPILYSWITVMRSRGLGAQTVKLVLLASIPVITGIVYLFHLAFGRPFMSKPGTKTKTEAQAEVAAVVNPAP